MSHHTGQRKGLSTSGISLMPSVPACGCGPDQGSKPGGHGRAGDIRCHWVTGFLETPAGPVPQIQTRLTARDKVTTAALRCGIHRYRYTVAPGLYAAGRPGAGSEVLVTANFKLSFDHLRRELAGLNLWILVLDTQGINVWCAAGKGTFATGELVQRIRTSGLAGIVDHRRVILPQLGATGVAASAVKADSGFRVVYGPVRASDIPKFLKNNRRADPEMRRMTFDIFERMILTPVEVQIAIRPALVTALALFILSGIGPGIFSLGSAWERGLTGFGALVTGMLSGAVVTPMLLPHIPVREFALKGIITGSAAALVLLAVHPAWSSGAATGSALVLFTGTVSSFLAMNFTGTTPFTSPSGVEKEMRRYIPVQLAALAASSACWIYGAF